MYNHFPKPWKHAILTMIPKPGKDQKFPLNFRPISLISSIGKIYEKILLKRIEKYTLDNSIIPDIQHGFRKETSTCHQLLRETNKLYLDSTTTQPLVEFFSMWKKPSIVYGTTDSFSK
ncbi:RNA-directed DNA polymerase from mobile element jockey [Trichonephila clavipes]|nr:RNA-directed DNA polymerase from mobile element jockey [Trichonephila clavipes]